MRLVEFKDVIPQINNNTFDFYNFYNADLDLEIFYGVQYYSNTKEDTTPEIEQKLKTVFTDIEVYHQDKNIEFKFDESLHPISAISFYYDGVFYAYFYNINNVTIDIPEWEEEFRKDLIKNNYIKDHETVEITEFKDELTLLKSYWNKCKEIDPAIITGWNSDKFDYPYIYRRILELTNNDEVKTNSIISRFNYVKLSKDMITIPEYSISDLMFLYKPREDGGRNYGKKRTSYSLDFVSDVELGLKKFEYKSKNLDINEFFEKNPKGYLFYNIIDVVLCVRLNDKLKHIELHNIIRRLMKSTYTKSLVGPSAIFDSHVLYTTNNKIRFGMNSQESKYIHEDEFKRIPKLRMDSKKGKQLIPSTIIKKDYDSAIFKYKGAYVTQPNSEIVDDGFTFSLDAASMYPSIILQHNISFDVFDAYIIPSITYKLLETLDNVLGKTNTVPEIIVKSIFDLVNKYVDNKDNSLQKKEETRKNLYFISMYLLQKIFDTKLTLKDILQPKNELAQLTLSLYLNHLISAIAWIHPLNKGYNNIVYDYLFDVNYKQNHKFLYLLRNPSSHNEYIEKLPISSLEELRKQYSMTVTGTCFTKHDKQLGLFTKLLEELFVMRKKYKKEMYNYPEDSFEFQLYNQRQSSVKVVMNSIYGTQGLKTFRYSNTYLAQSITTQGKLIIKLAQHISDKYLEQTDISSLTAGNK
jgi:DNA polymerase elongation subunit (family B)